MIEFLEGSVYGDFKGAINQKLDTPTGTNEQVVLGDGTLGTLPESVELPISISDVTNLQSSLDTKTPTTTTVNGHPLSSNVTVTTSDIGAATASDLTALASRVTTLENWKTATGIKRTERFNVTTNASGDVSLTFGTAVSNVNKVAFTIDGVYVATDHPLMPSIRALSTTGATIRVYRALTLLLLGTTVGAVPSQAVNITMIEFN